MVRLVLVAAAAALLAAGCGEGDPGAIGPAGVDGGLSAEGQNQEYVEGVSRALSQMFSGQGASYGKSVDTGNKKQLQATVIAWRQGVQQLKSINPPKEAVPGHTNLVKAAEALDGWNQRIAAAAPNKNRTKALAKQASNSAASRQLETAVCQIVDAGFEVADPGTCTPLANAAAPNG
jgi:hypothetical protein